MPPSKNGAVFLNRTSNIKAKFNVRFWPKADVPYDQELEMIFSARARSSGVSTPMQVKSPTLTAIE